MMQEDYSKFYFTNDPEKEIKTTEQAYHSAEETPLVEYMSVCRIQVQIRFM